MFQNVLERFQTYSNRFETCSGVLKHSNVERWNVSKRLQTVLKRVAAKCMLAFPPGLNGMAELLP
jgi:hypothetical protein